MLLHPEMGFKGKDPEPVKRPTAGISPPRTPLRSIRTRPSSEGGAAPDGEEDHLEGGCPSAATPTAKGARIPERLPCPPAPRKRRPPPRCRRSGGVVEFFSCPPDLEAVFLRRPDLEGQVK